MKKGKKSEHLENHSLHNKIQSIRKELDSLHMVAISEHDLMDLIGWARRYCDGRATYAPFSFNQVYKKIVQQNPSIKEKDQFDHTLKDKGAYWPYAQDGSFNASNGAYDARPLKPRVVSDRGLSISGSL